MELWVRLFGGRGYGKLAKRWSDTFRTHEPITSCVYLARFSGKKIDINPTRVKEEKAESRTMLDIPASASRVDSFLFLYHC